MEKREIERSLGRGVQKRGERERRGEEKKEIKRSLGRGIRGKREIERSGRATSENLIFIRGNRKCRHVYRTNYQLI